jgi:predicted transcriptional regulator
LSSEDFDYAPVVVEAFHTVNGKKVDLSHERYDVFGWNRIDCADSIDEKNAKWFWTILKKR